MGTAINAKKLRNIETKLLGKDQWKLKNELSKGRQKRKSKNKLKHQKGKQNKRIQKKRKQNKKTKEDKKAKQRKGKQNRNQKNPKEISSSSYPWKMLVPFKNFFVRPFLDKR